MIVLIAVLGILLLRLVAKTPVAKVPVVGDFVKTGSTA